MGVAVSPSQVASASPHTLPLLLHGHLQRESFHRVQFLRNRLLQCGSLVGSQALQQTYSSVGSSFHGAPGPARSLRQCRLSMGPQPPSGTHLLQRGDLPGLLHRGPWWAAGDSLPHHGLLHPSSSPAIKALPHKPKTAHECLSAEKARLFTKISAYMRHIALSR